MWLIGHETKGCVQRRLVGVYCLTKCGMDCMRLSEFFNKEASLFVLRGLVGMIVIGCSIYPILGMIIFSLPIFKFEASAKYFGFIIFAFTGWYTWIVATISVLLWIFNFNYRALARRGWIVGNLVLLWLIGVLLVSGKGNNFMDALSAMVFFIGISFPMWIWLFYAGNIWFELKKFIKRVL